MEMWYKNKMEFYSTTKNNEFTKFAGKWADMRHFTELGNPSPERQMPHVVFLMDARFKLLAYLI